MNILHVYKSYYPDSYGGIERVIYDLTREMPSDIQSQIFTISPHAKNLGDGWGRVPVIRAQQTGSCLSTPWSIEALSKFKSAIKSTDLIHYHYPWPYADVLTILSKVDKPIVITYHLDIVRQAWIEPIYAPLRHYLFSRAKAIVATSEPYQKSSYTLKKWGSKVTSISLGVDPPPLLDPHLIQLWKSQLPERFLLFLGGFRSYKGLDVLLQSVKLSGVPLVVVGSGLKSSHYQNLSRQLGIDSLVDWLGDLDESNKWAVLSLSAGLVLPSTSRAEAFGLVLIEAAMMGKALISTNLDNGGRLVNLPDVTGLVVPPGDSVALGKAMLELYRSVELAERLGNQARMHALGSFTASHMRHQYAALYRKILL